MADIQRSQFDGIVRRAMQLRGDLPSRLDPTILQVMDVLRAGLEWDDETQYWAGTATQAAVAAQVAIFQVDTSGLVTGSGDRVIVDGMWAGSDTQAANSLLFKLNPNAGIGALNCLITNHRAGAFLASFPAQVGILTTTGAAFGGNNIHQSQAPIPPEGSQLPFPVILELNPDGSAQQLAVQTTLVNTNLRASAWGRVIRNVTGSPR